MTKSIYIYTVSFGSKKLCFNKNIEQHNVLINDNNKKHFLNSKAKEISFLRIMSRLMADENCALP